VGGQAGLSVGYHLARRDRPFVILDEYERVGDAWRKRWDSLRLFTPARYDGNSGAEIAYEVVRTHRTWLSGKPSGQIPVRHGPAAARFVFPVVRFMGNRVLTRRTPIGRKIVPKLIAHGAPLIRVRLKDLVSAGVERVPRTEGVRDGLPELADGRVLDVSNVIWCTGFRYDFG
jgi:putative flavoprotein involved in K+ transport